MSFSMSMFSLSKIKEMFFITLLISEKYSSLNIFLPFKVLFIYKLLKSLLLKLYKYHTIKAFFISHN